MVQKLNIYFMPPPQKMPYDIPFKKIFWFCSKFDHKLLGTYTSLVQAVLSLAAGRTRSCPRSLSLTLLKNFFQNVKLDLFRHRLMVRHEENMTTKKMDDIYTYNSLVSKYVEMKTPLSFSLSPGISSVGHSVYNMRLISEAAASMDYEGPFSPFHTTRVYLARDFIFFGVQTKV